MTLHYNAEKVSGWIVGLTIILSIAITLGIAIAYSHPY